MAPQVSLLTEKSPKLKTLFFPYKFPINFHFAWHKKLGTSMLSLCLSVTSQSSPKMATYRITHNAAR